MKNSQLGQDAASIQEQSAVISNISNMSESEKANMKHSVRDVSSEVSGVDQAAKREFNARVKEIKDDADTQLKRLDADMNAIRSQAEADGMYYARGYNFLTLDRTIQQQLDNAKNEYEKKRRIVELREAKDLQDAQRFYNQRISATEGSALGIERTYASGSPEANLKLAPLGTNIYTRNYQTLGEPSGAPIPISAPPAKSLLPH